MSPLGPGGSGLRSYRLGPGAPAGPPAHGQHLLRSLPPPPSGSLPPYGPAGPQLLPPRQQGPGPGGYGGPGPAQVSFLGAPPPRTGPPPQKLHPQFQGHPLAGAGGGLAVGPGGGVGPVPPLYRGPLAPGPFHLPQQPPSAPPLPALPLNLMDTELVDEEVLTTLALELGLDREQELPELFLGQNEFDLVTDLAGKQQAGAVRC
uniref:Cbp/p300 interacting transactivator with Glu/Asp rich carboxy-terminal domain 4 n=2 Tax=Ornithorhynchus anatinus TaxID=9258 RepID=A0A6I8NI90_ORNAN